MKNKDMTILGVNDSHNASACIVRNGKVLVALAEERFQRVKGMGGFPLNAVRECLRIAELDAKNIDYFIFGSEELNAFNAYNGQASLSVEDWIKVQKEYWHPIIYQRKEKTLSSVLPDYKPEGEIFYDLSKIPFSFYREQEANTRKLLRQIRIDFVKKEFGISEEKIRFIDHHTAHAYYAFMANPNRVPGDEWTVITSDAGGDGLYESIQVFRQGKRQVLHRGSSNLLASIYSNITLLLAMRPNEHEYKLMGLAAYTNDYHKKGPRSVFENVISVNGLLFKKSPQMKDRYFYFKEKLEAHRFDGIAGGIQDAIEILLTKWITNIIAKTKIPKLAFSGGLSLNVKANKCITELPQVKDLFVPAGAGDESLAIGACYAIIDQESTSKGALDKIPPISTAYLGSKASKKDVSELINHKAIRGHYKIKENTTLKDVAKLLAKDNICAVFMDRMEFGPRALGHRSILANPSQRETVRKINEAIKKRDFWMPFAPAILSERFHDYLQDDKKVCADYMTMAFDTTKAGRQNLIAALHPSDFTARPQKVSKKSSPLFHKLISQFENLTGIGGVLNTSLNIHGKPIVEKPVQIADEIVSVSGIDLPYIYVEGTLLEKSNKK